MRRQPPWLAVVLVGAIVGVTFAAVSTYDFVQHLDRQVHNLHCSFIPGVSHGAGESGCQVAMMSPYSSVFRAHVWGGVPIALAALSVFAFLVFLSMDLALTRRKHDPRATGFLALATCLPAVTSLVMLVISLTKLGTTCKLCVGIYLASATCLAGALALWRTAANGSKLRGDAAPDQIGTAKSASSARLVAVDGSSNAASTGFIAAMFGIGVAFVVVPVALYLALAPEHARFIGTCESLPHPADSYGVMVRLDHGAAGGVPAIEVLDPLCPACRAFEQRLASSGLGERLDRKAVLFPLDNTCNWMVTEATHPGACTVSEAVLCSGDKAPQVIAWAFEEQDRIREQTKADPGAAARMVKQRFPELASCVGSPDARSRLNKSMRWIVANNIRVVTPQVYIDNVKLCDEDVDLGLEFMLSTMLDRHAHGSLKAVPLEGATPASPTAPPAAAEPATRGRASSKPIESREPSAAAPGGERGGASDKPAADTTDRPAIDPGKPAADTGARPGEDPPTTDSAADRRADPARGGEPAGARPDGTAPASAPGTQGSATGEPGATP